MSCLDEPPDVAPLYHALQRSAVAAAAAAAAATAASNDAAFGAAASTFGALDVDALLLIAQHLTPLPGATEWIEQAKVAVADLNALVRSCRFWRAVLCGAGHSLRLEAFALAQGCVPSPLLSLGDGAGRYFAQMLAQERHLVHLRVLGSTAELMLTHCTREHCTDALRAMRTYRSSPFIVDAASASMAKEKHALARRALEGKRVNLSVAATSATFKWGIVASQAARGTAAGGVLLVAEGSDPVHSNEGDLVRPSCHSVFSYVSSERARLYSPASELQKSIHVHPKKRVTAASVRGDVAILCLEEEDVGDAYSRAVHLVSLWSLTSHREAQIAESSRRNGRAVEVWATEGVSSDRGAYLEIFTLVVDFPSSTYGSAGWCTGVCVCTDRYARDAGVWAATMSTNIGLGSHHTLDTEWRYFGAHGGPYEKGVSLCDAVKVASESPLGAVALCVCGWICKIPQFPEDAETPPKPTLVYRIVVANKNPQMTSTRFNCGALPHKVHVINVFRAPYEGFDLAVATVASMEARVPHVHLSPCGTLLVTTCKRNSTAPEVLTIYRCDPQSGWRRLARHERADSYSTISGTPLKPAVGLWKYEIGHGPPACSQKFAHFGWAHPHYLSSTLRRPCAGVFSPCGKYLALLTRCYIFIFDLHSSLCHGTLHVRGIRVSDQTRPVALAWPDGLFVETNHGVLHIGTYDDA